MQPYGDGFTRFTNSGDFKGRHRFATLQSAGHRRIVMAVLLRGDFGNVYASGFLFRPAVALFRGPVPR
jgi:hypothetical protein